MNKTPILRKFEPSLAEYEAIVQVWNAANPNDPGSADTWQHWDQHREPDRLFTRYVAEQQTEIVGYGYSFRTDPAANIFRFAIYFLPQWQTVELIHEFYSFIMESCLESEPTALIVETREDETEKIDWLRNQGFEETMRYPRSILELAAFDPVIFSKTSANIKAQGIDILSLTELAQRDVGWKKKVYELEMILSKDVPRPSEFRPPPFEKYVQNEFEAPQFMPDLWLIAVDSDSYVGMSSLFKSGDDIESLETGLTGVRREYRRRGLASALKCQNIEEAKSLGTQQIQTSNEENNPMFQINLRLGFQAQPADVDWEKAIDNDN
jgi:GNAT superfamily N-acetyltransferase